MTYNLTLIDGNNIPLQGFNVSISRNSDNVQEFSGDTDANGLISATLTDSTVFLVNIAKANGRLRTVFSLTTGTSTISTTKPIHLPTITSIGVSVNTKTIPPIFSKQVSFSLKSLGVVVDWGTIPPKNYYRSTYYNVGVTINTESKSELFYQIM